MSDKKLQITAVVLGGSIPAVVYLIKSNRTFQPWRNTLHGQLRTFTPLYQEAEGRAKISMPGNLHEVAMGLW